LESGHKRRDRHAGNYKRVVLNANSSSRSPRRREETELSLTRGPIEDGAAVEVSGDRALVRDDVIERRGRCQPALHRTDEAVQPLQAVDLVGMPIVSS
jgi:hypothetical protein